MKHKLILGILGIIVIGGSVWVFLPEKSVLSEKDQTKALKNILGREAHLTADKVDTSWAIHTSKYIQFSYPKIARIYTEDNENAMKQPGTFDSFSFSNLDEHVTVVLQVKKFQDSLEEYPAVHIRLMQKDVYKESDNMFLSAKEEVFTKDEDTIEKSAFFKTKDMIVSIAVTGYNTEKVENMFERVHQSIKIF